MQASGSSTSRVLRHEGPTSWRVALIRAIVGLDNASEAPCFGFVVWIVLAEVDHLLSQLSQQFEVLPAHGDVPSGFAR